MSVEKPNSSQTEAGATIPSRWSLGFGRPVLWIIIVLVILSAVTALLLYRYYSVRETTDDAQIDGHIYPVAARVGGTVVSVKVEDNQYVTQGGVLVELDRKDYEVALQRAKADLAEAEAQAKAASTQVPVTTTTTTNQVSTAQVVLSRAESATTVAAREVDAAQARLGLAQARVREAAVNHTRTVQDLQRLKQLVGKDEISRQDYDHAVTAEEAARAAQASAEAAASEAEKDVASAQARLAHARLAIPEAQAALDTARTGPQQTAMTQDRARSAAARVEVLKATLEQAGLNLGYTVVRAPASGIVSVKSVEVGQIVQPGQPLLALVPLEDIWVKANFKENQLKDMRPGQAAEISVDAFGGRTFRGHVESISAATGARFSLLPPENATGNYVKVVQRIPVKILFEKGQDPEHKLRPGMSVVPTVLITSNSPEPQMDADKRK
jgi:membrane fusion protein (multidrug efflux system)